jgi:hypothetical protein
MTDLLRRTLAEQESLAPDPVEVLRTVRARIVRRRRVRVAAAAGVAVVLTVAVVVAPSVLRAGPPPPPPLGSAPPTAPPGPLDPVAVSSVPLVPARLTFPRVPLVPTYVPPGVGRTYTALLEGSGPALLHRWPRRSLRPGELGWPNLYVLFAASEPTVPGTAQPVTVGDRPATVFTEGTPTTWTLVVRWSPTLWVTASMQFPEGDAPTQLVDYVSGLRGTPTAVGPVFGFGLAPAGWQPVESTPFIVTLSGGGERLSANMSLQGPVGGRPVGDATLTEPEGGDGQWVLHVPRGDSWLELTGSAGLRLTDADLTRLAASVTVRPEYDLGP